MLKNYITRTFTEQDPTRKLVLLGFLLSLPAISIGLQTDDYIKRYRMIHDRLPSLGELQEMGFLWWEEEASGQRFLRPLANLSHWLDFNLWSNPAGWAHLQNSLLYALLIAVICLCYRLLGLSRLAIGLGGLFYTLNAGNAYSVGWISGRNTLLYTLFAILTLALHHRARTQSLLWARVLAPLCLALGLASGEGAVAIVGYLVGHAIFLDRGTLRSRLLGLIPHVIIVIAWRIYYVSAGYGASGLGWYHDVTQYPLQFVADFLEALPIYLATLLVLPLANLTIFGTTFKYGLLVLSIIILALLWPLFRGLLREHAVARFALFGAVASVVPLGTTQVQDRLTTLVAMGTSMLLGMLIAQHWTQPVSSGSRARSTLYILHTYVAVFMFIAALFAITRVSAPAKAIVNKLSTDTSVRSILVNVPNPVVLLYPVFIADERGRSMPGSLYTLYAGSSSLTVRRIDERTLELNPDAGFLATPIERTRRSLNTPFREGQVRALDHMTVEVVSVDHKGAPKTVRFHFDASLDDPSWQLLSWDGKQPVDWTPPAVGETIQLSATRAI